MKRIFLFTLLSVVMIFPLILRAQYAIPNGSFENWTGKNQPANWVVIQGSPTQDSLASYTYVDSAGDTLAFVRYANDGASFIDMRMADTTSPCIISQKFAMTGRPKYFSMNYAYFPETRRDQFQVGFIFTKWNTFTMQEDTILAGDYNSKQGLLAPPWSTILKADLSSIYNPNTSVAPDSATVVINSSLQSSPNSKTLLLIDKIYFTDTIVTAGIKLPETVASKDGEISAYPNPFSQNATIRYHLAQAGHVQLCVYDAEGKQVATLVNTNQMRGSYDVAFDATGLNNGIYFYRLISGNDVQAGQLILEK